MAVEPQVRGHVVPGFSGFLQTVGSAYGCSNQPPASTSRVRTSERRGSDVRTPTSRAAEAAGVNQPSDRWAVVGSTAQKRADEDMLAGYRHLYCPGRGAKARPGRWPGRPGRPGTGRA